MLGHWPSFIIVILEDKEYMDNLYAKYVDIKTELN